MRLGTPIWCSHHYPSSWLGLFAGGSVGPTRYQMLSFLKCGSVDEMDQLASELGSKALADSSAHGGPELCLAKGAWVDGRLNLNPPFKQIAKNEYKAAYKQVEFQTK